jgi:hypothetical protein
MMHFPDGLLSIFTKAFIILLFTISRFCVLLIAINIGIIAAIVDIGAIWLTNIKTGVCLPAFYLSREQCCVCLSN